MQLKEINEKFGHGAERMLKRRWWVILAFIAALVVSFHAMQSMVMESSFDDYFMEDDPVLKMTDEFKSHFGNDYFVGVLTQCDDHFTHDKLQLLRKLCNELMDSLSYAEKITSLTDIEFMVGSEDGMTIEQIVPDEIPTSQSALDSVRMRAYSKPNVARKLISADGKLSWILVKLRTFPEDSVWKQTSNIAPDMITGAETHHIITKPEYASLHPLATGMPYTSQQKVEYIHQAMGKLMIMALIICVVVMLIMTRSLRGVVAPIIAIVGGLFMMFGLSTKIFDYVDMTTTMVPVILAFAVAIAYNIHFFTYFNSRMRIHGCRLKAVIETVSEIGWSVCFCGLTTIVSLLSFLAISIRPMQNLGIMCSLSVLFILLITITITPVLLSFGKDRKVLLADDSPRESRMSRLMVGLGDFNMRHSRVLCSCFAAICVVLCIGMFKIEPAFDVERTMGKDVDYVSRLLEVGNSELGSLYSYDLMIEFPNNDEAKQPKNLRALEQMEKVACEYKQTKRTTSILDILKDLNQTLNEGDTTFYAIPKTEEEVAQLLMLYENAGGSEAEYWVDYDYRRLRLMIEISNYNSADSEYEMADIQAQAHKLFPSAQVTVVGNLPQFTTMMQYLVRGQMQSFFISILIIGIIMMIAFQSIRLGLLGMIPNVMPAIFVGGYMGWQGIPLDMMTATIIPMMLGLAVDDTIHFFNHSKLEFDRTGDYDESSRRTFRVVGVAIVSTSIITSAVFGTFITDQCLNILYFGLLAIIGILSALAADLIITPALMKYFKVFGSDNNQSQN